MILNQLCNIERETSVKNNYGQNTKSWNIVYEDVKCNIQMYQPRSSNIIQSENGQVSTADYIGVMGPIEDIKMGDRIYWYSELLYVVRAFLVFGRGNTPHHKEIWLKVEGT